MNCGPGVVLSIVLLVFMEIIELLFSLFTYFSNLLIRVGCQHIGQWIYNSFIVYRWPFSSSFSAWFWNSNLIETTLQNQIRWSVGPHILSSFILYFQCWNSLPLPLRAGSSATAILVGRLTKCSIHNLLVRVGTPIMSLSQDQDTWC